MNTNVLTITGRLTKDPEARKTSGGKDVCSFTIACNNSKNGDHGGATFFDCQAWGQDALHIEQFAGKGRLMLVVGRIQTRKYKASDGSDRTVWEVKVDRWELLDRPRETTETKPVADTDYDPFGDDE